MTETPVLICAFSTLAGVSPAATPAISPHSLETRVEAAAASGYRGFGFGYADLQHMLTTRSLDEIDATLSAHGMRERVLEVLPGWFEVGDAWTVHIERRGRMLEWAHRLGIRNVKVGGDRSGRVWPPGHLAERFATLCDAAAEAGAEITIELFPDSNLRDLETGGAVVRNAGRANGGLLVDIWSVMRGGMSIDAISAAPRGLINYVELNDGPLIPDGELMAETLSRRLAPGEGEFPLRKFVTALKASGYRGPYGVEIMSNALRVLAPAEAARASVRGVWSLFD